MPKTLISQRSTGTKVAFGDVVQLSRERSSDPERDGHERFVGLEHIDPSDLRIRRWGNVADGVTFTSVFRPGQVLFGKRRAYQRKVAVADFSGVCSGDIYVLEPKGNALLPELLPFICQSDAFFEHAVGTSAGSLSPRTNWDSLASFEFTLPPIEEQRRLVEPLRSSGELAGALMNLHKSALGVFRCLGSAMTTSRNAGSSWNHVPLGELIRSERSLSYGILKPGSHDPSGIPMFRVENVDEVGLRTCESVMRVSSEVEATKKSTRLRGGDVLVSVVATIGRVFRVTDDMKDWNISRAWAVISPRRDVDPDYLAVFLQSANAQAFFRARCTGSAQSVLNIGELKRLPVPVPSLALQREIAQAAECARRNAVLARQRMLLIRSMNRKILNEAGE